MTPEAKARRRANRKLGKRLDRQNAYGANDPTPRKALQKLRGK